MTLISKSIGIAVITLSAIALAVMSFTPAFAETRVDANASTSADVKFRPLRILNETRLDLKAEGKNILNNFKDARIDLRADTKAEVRNASTTEERKNILRDAREDRADLRADFRADLSANIKERVQLALRASLGAIVNRMNAAAERFDNIQARMESRIEKLKAEGATTASVEASVDAAEALKVQAKADIQALTTLIASVNDSTDRETFKTEIRAAVQKATASIKATHSAFLRAAEQLKALVNVSAKVETNTNVEVNN